MLQSPITINRASTNYHAVLCATVSQNHGQGHYQSPSHLYHYGLMSSKVTGQDETSILVVSVRCFVAVPSEISHRATDNPHLKGNMIHSLAQTLADTSLFSVR